MLEKLIVFVKEYSMEAALEHTGYFSSGLRKLELAREVARRMEPERNTSRSFHAFANAVSTAMAWN